MSDARAITIHERLRRVHIVFTGKGRTTRFCWDRMPRITDA